MKSAPAVDEVDASYLEGLIGYNARRAALAVIEVFLDPLQNSVKYHHVDGEERWQTVGMVDGRLILVVHTDRKNHDGTQIIRIISARRPERSERRFYEEGGDR